MRCGLLFCAFALMATPAAAAAQPAVTASATPQSGAAPLDVVLSAKGDAATYAWDLGDGTFAQGATVTHTYAAGRWTAVVTARATDGETSTAAVEVTAVGLELAAPQHMRYGKIAVFRGSLTPAQTGTRLTLVGPRGPVAASLLHADGSFSIRARVRFGGDYVVQTEAGLASAPQRVLVAPQLRTRLIGSGARGSRYVLAVDARPDGAGAFAVTIQRGGRAILERTWDGPFRVALDTRRLTTYSIRVELKPNDGYVPVTHLLRAHVVLPRLLFGATGTAVAELGSRLRELHYAAPYSATFDSRMLDSVYAFEKVQGLDRTGAVEAAFWTRLADPRLPLPRFTAPSSHIEIDKSHQVLYVVRNSQVALIVPVSTAGLPGRFTPVGRFAIYRKVLGFDPSPLGTLFDPMYFTAGYAIHGNPSVPPYPASHGCVRVPMWLAPYLYETNPYGETVYVY